VKNFYKNPKIELDFKKNFKFKRSKLIFVLLIKYHKEILKMKFSQKSIEKIKKKSNNSKVFIV